MNSGADGMGANGVRGVIVTQMNQGIAKLHLSLALGFKIKKPSAKICRMPGKMHQELLDAYAEATRKYTASVEYLSTVPRDSTEKFKEAYEVAADARDAAGNALNALKKYLETDAATKAKAYHEAATALYRAQLDRSDTIPICQVALEEARKAKIEASNAVVEFQAKRKPARLKMGRRTEDVA